MASRAHKPGDGPDGAKPGAEDRAPSDRHAYDADGRAKAREEAPITIGGRHWHRKRRNWKVTREVRKLLRDQEKAQGHSRRLQAQIAARGEQVSGIRDYETGDWKTPPITDAAALEQLEAEIDALNKQVDKVDDESDLAVYRILMMLLRAEDGDTGPTLKFLQDECDYEELGELAGMLASGAEPTEGPTPTASSSS